MSKQAYRRTDEAGVGECSKQDAQHSGDSIAPLWRARTLSHHVSCSASQFGTFCEAYCKVVHCHCIEKQRCCMRMPAAFITCFCLSVKLTEHVAKDGSKLTQTSHGMKAAAQESPLRAKHPYCERITAAFSTSVCLSVK